MKKVGIGKLIILSIVTCGIYSLVWYWNTIKALDAEGGKSTMSPAVQFVLMFVYVGSFLFGLNANENINAIRAKKGKPEVDNKVLWVVLGLIPIVQAVLVQSAINELVDA